MRKKHIIKNRILVSLMALAMAGSMAAPVRANAAAQSEASVQTEAAGQEKLSLAASETGETAEQENPPANIVIEPVEEELIIPDDADPDWPEAGEEDPDRPDAGEDALLADGDSLQPARAEETTESADAGKTRESADTVGTGNPTDALLAAKKEAEQMEESGVMPAKYPSYITADDLSGLKQNYPTVRNQGGYGCCWAFSSNGTAELYLLANGYVDKDVDFSELSTAYSVYNTVQDPLGGLDGDSIEIQSETENFLSLGGNCWWALENFFKWFGPNEESDIPYSSALDVLASGVDDALILNASAHIVSARQLDPVDERDRVKETIIRNGAVAGAYFARGKYYSSAGNAYYCNTSQYGTNHGVTIIGWDDNFSAEKFAEMPLDADENPINGAWLARNSWGTNGAGYHGYFWISYADRSFHYTRTGEHSCVYAAEYVMPGNQGWHDHNYQYDGSYASSEFYFQDTEAFSAANIFTAAKEEDLAAVSVAVGSKDTDYTIKVYTNLTNPKNPESGNLETDAVVSGTFDGKGIYQVELPQKIRLDEGTVYSVVVELTSDNTPKITAERTSRIQYTDDTYIEFTAHKEAGQSMYKSNVTWFDVTNHDSLGNFRIKAMTDDIDTPGPGPVDPEPDWIFSDVKVNPGNWIYEAVKYVWQKGIMTGDAMAEGETMTTFRPNEDIKRRELVKMLWTMEGCPEPLITDSIFTDVQDSSKWYYKAVLWANENGIVTGDKMQDGETMTTFRPGDSIKRQELATMLYRYAAYKGYDLTKSEDFAGFEDGSRVSGYARDAMLWATAQGIITGSEKNEYGLTTYWLNPKLNTLRKQCAKMFQNFCTKFRADSGEEDTESGGEN